MITKMFCTKKSYFAPRTKTQQAKVEMKNANEKETIKMDSFLLSNRKVKAQNSRQFIESKGIKRIAMLQTSTNSSYQLPAAPPTLYPSCNHEI